jgi:hypothetical protein
MDKKQFKKFDQELIDAYEGYMWNIQEAVRFLKMGYGKPSAHIFEKIEELMKIHEKECWDKIEKAMDKQIAKEL